MGIAQINAYTMEVGEITHVELARPPANAMVPEFLNKISDQFLALAQDAMVKAIVLKGNGRVFSARMDLKAAGSAYDATASDQLLLGCNRAFGAVYGCLKPAIGDLNGHAIAGGMVLALCCDYRIATNSKALFGQTEVRVAVPFREVACNVIQDQLPSTN